jgi:dTDP-4-dehydrorhamnose reductase
MRILLLGRNGQVGWELQRSLAVLGEIVALGSNSADNPAGLCGDFRDSTGLRTTLGRVRPDVIVNAAAYTAVDKAEAEPDLAHAINALAPELLSEYARASGAWLLHFSTDYVFDGSGQAAWLETSPTDPLSVYGRSKLAGEVAVAQCPHHLILRTSWVYAARGSNFARSILRLAAGREQLRVISDQFGAPTSAEMLADVSAHVLHAVVHKPNLGGLYHCAAAGETSWHGYAQWLVEHAHGMGRKLLARPQDISPIASSEYPTAATRPMNSRLNTTKLQQAFGLELPDWRPGVTRLLQEITDTQ